MRGPHHAHAGRHWTRTHIVDAEQLKSGACAHDVDDRVDAPHFVKMHLLGRASMHTPLDLGQRSERRERSPPHPRRQAGLFYERADVAERADHAGLRGVDAYVGGCNTSTQHRLGLDRPTVDRYALQDAADFGEIGARVDETPESHVAGDAVEAVEPCDGGHGGALGPPGSQKAWAAAAAPQPLSGPATR